MTVIRYISLSVGCLNKSANVNVSALHDIVIRKSVFALIKIVCSKWFHFAMTQAT